MDSCRRAYAIEGILEDIVALLDKFQQQTATRWGTWTFTTAEKQTELSSCSECVILLLYCITNIT